MQEKQGVSFVGFRRSHQRLLVTLLQRMLSAVILAFLVVLESLISIAFASALGSLMLTTIGW